MVVWSLDKSCIDKSQLRVSFVLYQLEDRQQRRVRVCYEPIDPFAASRKEDDIVPADRNLSFSAAEVFVVSIV